MTHVLTIPWERPPMLANDQRRWHWTKVRSAKDEVGSGVFWYARRAGLPKRLGPSRVEIVWYAPDRRRRDADSLAPFLKATLDALVHYGCWPDDHSQYVTAGGMSISHDPDHPRIEIRITERNEP